MEIQIRLITMEEREEVFSIYQSLKGTKGCTWDEGYPVREDVKRDIENKELYGVYQKGELIAAAALLTGDDLDALSCWSKEIRHPADLARIGVLPKYQRQGVAKFLLANLERIAKEKGFDGIHFLAGKKNLAALHLYEAMKYQRCGEAQMYEEEWWCYEKEIDKLV